MKRTLYLKQVTLSQICEQWDMPASMFARQFREPCFVRCNKKGEVNWDKTLLYQLSELKERLICIL